MLLPVLVLLLVTQRFTTGAVLVVLLSKWRMFSVRPRYWLANIKANLVDLTVSLAIVSYMDSAWSGSVRVVIFVWAALYIAWLLFVKPKSTSLAMTAQALIALAFGSAALYAHYSTWSPVVLILLTWLICYGTALHFLTSFEDEANKAMTHTWAMFGAQLSLILNHWIIVYNKLVPQISLILSLIGYALVIAYYLHKTKGLKATVRQQLIVFTIGIIILVVVFSDWQYKGF